LCQDPFLEAGISVPDELPYLRLHLQLFFFLLKHSLSDEKIVRSNSMKSISSMGPIHKKHSVSLISVNRWVTPLTFKINIAMRQDQGGIGGTRKFTLNCTSSSTRCLRRLPTKLSQTPSSNLLEVDVTAMMCKCKWPKLRSELLQTKQSDIDGSPRSDKVAFKQIFS